MILQRYVRERWPALRGERPFIVTGPSFARWCKVGRGVKPFDRCSKELVRELQHAVDAVGFLSYAEAKRGICELMLEMEIVQALWLRESSISDDRKRELSIEEFAGEVPHSYHGTGVADDVLELLDGMSAPEYIRSHMLHETDRDEVVLIPFKML